MGCLFLDWPQKDRSFLLAIDLLNKKRSVLKIKGVRAVEYLMMIFLEDFHLRNPKYPILLFSQSFHKVESMLLEKLMWLVTFFDLLGSLIRQETKILIHTPGTAIFLSLLQLGLSSEHSSAWGKP